MPGKHHNKGAMHESFSDAQQVNEWHRIAYILGRTPQDAARRFAQRADVADMILPMRGLVAAWQDAPFAPRWALQHRLLREVLRLRFAQRVAVVQMLFPRQLGAVSNTYALFQALVRLGRYLEPAVLAKQLVATPAAYQCRRSRIFLANGQQHLVEAHVRHCADCRQAGLALQRIRQAVMAVVMTASFPPLPATSVVPWQGWGVMGCLLLLGVGMWYAVQARPTVVDVPMPTDARAVLVQADNQLWQIPAMSADQEYAVHVRMFWRFESNSVAMLDGRIWYQATPTQYRAQLVHTAGGNPFELDIVTESQRLYHVTEAYVGSVWPLRAQATTLVRATAPFTVDEMLMWRLRQGAWAVGEQLLSRGMRAPQLDVTGVAVTAHGDPMWRIRSRDDQGELWFDVDVATNRVIAMWQIIDTEPRLMWQHVADEVQPIRDARRYLVIQPTVGEPQWLRSPALHPALPLVDVNAGTRQQDVVQFTRDDERCRVELSQSIVQQCEAETP